MMLKLVTPPAAEPVSLAEAKLHLRVEHDAENDLIDLYIKSAREAAEQITGRSYLDQTWELALDAFPEVEIELRMPNVMSIESVKYTDADGIEQTIDSTNYTLDSQRLIGWVLPAVGFSWPTTYPSANAVRVRFHAGYGVDATGVPACVKHWMLLQIGAAYMSREAFAAGFSVADLPNRFVDRLLDGERTFL